MTWTSPVTGSSVGRAARSGANARTVRSPVPMDGIKFKRPPVGAKHTSTREACRASLARQEHGHRLFDEPQRNVTIRSRSVVEPLAQSVGDLMAGIGFDSSI